MGKTGSKERSDNAQTKRVHTCTVRLSEQEFEMMKAGALVSGRGDVSQYLRGLISGEIESGTVQAKGQQNQTATQLRLAQESLGQVVELVERLEKHQNQKIEQMRSDFSELLKDVSEILVKRVSDVDSKITRQSEMVEKLATSFVNLGKDMSQLGPLLENQQQALSRSVQSNDELSVVFNDVMVNSVLPVVKTVPKAFADVEQRVFDLQKQIGSMIDRSDRKLAVTNQVVGAVAKKLGVGA